MAAATQITALGNVKRMMAVRLKPGTDVLLEIEKACLNNGIRNGVVVSGIGGVTTAVFCDPNYFPERKQPYNYGAPIMLEEPLSIAGISGIICHDDDGTVNTHIHVSFSNVQGQCFAGHLKEGTRTMLTVDLVIAEIDGLSMSRKFDEELEVPLFCPVQE